MSPHLPQNDRKMAAKLTDSKLKMPVREMCPCQMCDVSHRSPLESSRKYVGLLMPLLNCLTDAPPDGNSELSSRYCSRQREQPGDVQ